MKSFLGLLSLLLFEGCMICSTAFGAGFYYNDDDQNQFLKSEAGSWTKDIASSKYTGEGQKDGLLQVIKNGINRVLGLLALIALIILLRGGFQMVTAAGDDKKYEAGYTYLKQAAGGLIMIGVAWFLVSIIFYVIHIMTK